MREKSSSGLDEARGGREGGVRLGRERVRREEWGVGKLKGEREREKENDGVKERRRMKG